MSLKLLKILLILAVATAVTCCFTVDIFGSVLWKTVCFSATGLAILIPVIMAIRQPKRYLHYLNLLVLIGAPILCFSADCLQKTLFAYQRTSTYHFQQDRKAFIKQNEHYILTEVKRIEALIAKDTFQSHLETVFIDLQGNPPKDTIIEQVIRGIPRKLRQVDIDFKANSLGFRQTDSYVLQSCSVQNGKIIRLSLYNPGFKASPYFYNSALYFYPYGNVDKEYFTSEVAAFGSRYYLKYCQTRNYLFEGKWVFQVEGKCFG